MDTTHLRIKDKACHLTHINEEPDMTNNADHKLIDTIANNADDKFNVAYTFDHDVSIDDVKTVVTIVETTKNIKVSHMDNVEKLHPEIRLSL